MIQQRSAFVLFRNKSSSASQQGRSCSEGHYGSWTSSKELCEKHGRRVYTNSLLIAAGIFLTGNNYDKLALFCQFLGLELILKATYNRVQTHYYP